MRLNSDSSGSGPESGSVTRDSSRGRSVAALSRTPSNELTSQTAALVQAIRPSTSERWNLVWSFGSFLEYLPQRLGRNEALDFSVSAISLAHSDFCNYRKASPLALNKYSQALAKLRACLNVPEIACTSDTLCAVMLLLMTQVRSMGTIPNVFANVFHRHSSDRKVAAALPRATSWAWLVFSSIAVHSMTLTMHLRVVCPEPTPCLSLQYLQIADT